MKMSSVLEKLIRKYWLDAQIEQQAVENIGLELWGDVSGRNIDQRQVIIETIRKDEVTKGNILRKKRFQDGT